MIIPKEYIYKIDNIYILEITGELILYYEKYPEKLQEKQKDLEYSKYCYNGSLYNLEITLAKASIYDGYTQRYSESSIYRNKKGYYIKKLGKKYYIDIKDKQ